MAHVLDEYGNETEGYWNDPNKPQDGSYGQGNDNPTAPAPAPPKEEPKAAPAKKSPFDRETYRTGWGGGTPEQLKAYNDQFEGVQTKNDVSYLPTGEAMDMIIDSGSGGKNAAAWTGLGAWTGTPGAGAGATITPYADPGGGSSGASSSAGPFTPPSSLGISAPGSLAGTSLFNSLVGRANQSLSVDGNDPIIKAQSDAFNAQTERANRQYLHGLAEKSGPNANLSAETRLASERAGQAGGNMKATLMANEVSARRQEIQAALSQQQGLLSQDQQAALQKELALLDDATRRLGINTQNSQFYSGLANNNDQFLANFGLNTTNQANYWDAARNPSSYPGLGGS